MNNEEKELLQLLSTPHLRVKKYTADLSWIPLHNSQQYSVQEKLLWGVCKRNQKPPTNKLVLFHCDFLQQALECEGD